MISRKRQPPVGTTFKFTLNEPATVTLRFTALRARTRRRVAGGPSFTGHAGVNKIRFYGRLSRKAKLKLGRYGMTIVAVNASGQSASSKALTFTIVK